MYDTKYECQYHKDSVFIESDVVTENEKQIITDILYKEDLLNIFGINDDDFDIFDSVMLELYEKISKCEEFKTCMKLAASKLMSENENMGLCILYSYDYMYLTHKCISEYLENNEINTIPLLTKLEQTLSN